MKSVVAAIFVLLVISTASACAAHEVHQQDSPETPLAGWNVRTARLVDLMADRDTFPVMQKHVPHIVAQIEFGTGIQVPLYFTLEHFLGVPEAQIDEEDLLAIQEDLDAINIELGLAAGEPADSAGRDASTGGPD